MNTTDATPKRDSTPVPNPTASAALAGQTALITGATGGIGRAVSRFLGALGVALCLTAPSEEALASVQSDLRRGKSHAIPADFTDERQVRGLAALVEKKCGAVHVLVHCAGCLSVGPVESAPVDELDRQYYVNVRAPYLLTQLLLPALRRNAGQVVFVNSSIVFHPRAGLSQYGATKHALRGLADALRDEVNKSGIRVITIYPGRTASKMQRCLCEVERRAYHPERLSQPEDVASAIVAALQMPRTTDVLDLVLRPTALDAGDEHVLR